MSAPAASPCVGICNMDDATGWCEGCLRTIDEIALWSVLEEADKRALLLALARRRPQWRLQHPPRPLAD